MTKPTILPSSSESLGELAKIQGDDRCVLTVYFPGSLAKGAKTAAELAELPASLLPADSLTRDEAEHFRRSLDLWRDTLRTVSLQPAEGWMAAISWLTENAAFMELPIAVEPAAYLDNSPFLLPAGRLLDDLEAYAVVYADHTRAAIYLAALGKFREENRLRGEIKNHVRKGGWSQQRYERRRDKEIHHYCRAMLDKLDDLVKSEGLRRIVLAGDRILLAELEKRMSAERRGQVVCRIPMEDKKDPTEIFRQTLSATAQEEEREGRRLEDAIRNEHASHGRAVIGPEATLGALLEKRVRWLLIGPMDGVTAWRCPACGTFGLNGQPTCPDCHEPTYPQNAANEFTDLAFAAQTRVEFTHDPLTSIHGVGALLRW